MVTQMKSHYKKGISLFDIHYPSYEGQLYLEKNNAKVQ